MAGCGGNALPKESQALAAEDFLELARARQKYTLDAARVLGLAEDSLVYLGYPDAGLAQMPMATGDTPYRSPFTGKNRTYGPVYPDYHSQMHQNPAPYLRTAALADITELLQRNGRVRFTSPTAQRTRTRIIGLLSI